MGDPPSSHPFQGNGHLAVVDIRPGDDGPEGNTPVSNIQMQLVALPIIIVALTIAFASPAT